MTKRLLQIFLLTFLLASCSDSETNRQKSGPPKYDSLDINNIIDTIEINKHKDLVWSDVKHIDADLLSKDFSQFEDSCTKIFTNKKTSDSLLIITSYFDKSGCTIYQPNIDIRNDSIFLLLESTTNIVCTELEIYKVIYHIKTSGKKYVLTK
jgi:hypothetical protein